MQVQKLGGSTSKNFGAKNMRHFGHFYSTSESDRQYLPNDTKYPKSDSFRLVSLLVILKDI